MPGPISRLSLPFTDWPEVDRQMWSDAVNDDDPFTGGGRARLRESHTA